MKSKYSKENPCTLCNKSFTEKGSLGRHIKLVHEEITPEKMFKCANCDKIYISSHGLNTLKKFEV